MELKAILEAVNNNPDLAKSLLENVPTIQGGKEYLENSNKVHFESNIGPEISKIYNRLDEDIFSVTGLKKEANQKSYDFLKDVVTNLKKKSEDNQDVDVKALKTTIKDLEDKVKNGETSTHWKDSYNDVLGQLNNQKEEYETKLSSLNNEMLTSKVQSDLSSGLATLKLNDSLPESVVKAMVNQVNQKLTLNAKTIDGVVTYFDNDGKPIRNKSFETASASFILKQELADILQDDKPRGGGANQTGAIVTNGAGDSAKKTLQLDKGTFNTKVDFNKQAEKVLHEQGISRGTKEWNTLMDDAYKSYGVSDMERI